MIILPEIPDVLIDQIEVADEITLTLHTTSPTACCSSCGTASSRVQSRYTRRLRDLPASGRAVTLIIEVRRFFCTKRTCSRKIFAEQVPSLCRPHAQRTKRLQEALRQLGLTIGGQAGADVASEQGISGSRDTILRLVRQHSLPDPPKSPIVGIDDWAWKRGQRYGTLICDLEQGVPIDLLADRSVETVSAWFKAHPHVNIVSRDGSSEYASAIKKGAPQARQVSDRWHLIKNLAGCVSAVLAQSLAELRRAEQAVEREEGKRPAKVYRQARRRTETIAQQARQAERQERYQYISFLRKQGMSSTQIAAQVGMPGPTVRRWLARAEVPNYKQHSKRPSPIDPYMPYLQQRWEEGCHNGLQLWRELRAKGFKGSSSGVYLYLSMLSPSAPSLPKQSLVGERTQEPSLIQPHPLRTISVQKATWLFFRKAEELKEEEQEILQLIRQLSPSVETAYQLVETFLLMARESKGEQLETWLSAAEASHLEAFESFTTSVQKDKDAVLAGLTLPWSNGLVEGHVNRLKFIKRSMYGRAQFDLLKLRVLHRHRRNVERKKKLKQKQEHQVGLLKKSRCMKSGTNSHHTTSLISEVA
jgi:transposase